MDDQAAAGMPRELATKIVERALQALVRGASQSPADLVPYLEGHGRYLVEALAFGQPRLYSVYADWVWSRLAADQAARARLSTLLSALAGALANQDQGAEAGQMVRAAADPHGAIGPPGHDMSTPPGLSDELAARFLSSLLGGERGQATDLVCTAVAEGRLSVADAYRQVFEPALKEIGRLWETNRISVAQEHFATAVVQFAMSRLYGQVFAGPRNGGRVLAACVETELHEVGMRMVSDFLEMAGWDTYFLGSNTPVQGIVELAKEKNIEVIAFSATTVPHIRQVEAMIAELRNSLKGHRYWVVVGGAAFNLAADLWKSVGADGTARNADDAVRLLSDLTGRKAMA